MLDPIEGGGITPGPFFDDSESNPVFMDKNKIAKS